MPTDPVHIIGAGPVGLLLACLLGQQGRQVFLYEKRRELPAASMAIGITPPSLEILHHLGLRHTFLARGVRIPAAQVFEDLTPVGALRFRSSETQILSLPQFGTVSLLREKLADFPTVHFQEGREIHPQDLSALPGWQIACDGWRSRLREAAGIPLRHKSYGVHFVMADFEDVEDLGPEARLYFSRSGAVESFPLPGRRRRWIAQVVPPAEPDLNTLFERGSQAAGIDLSRRRQTGPLCPFSPAWSLAATYVRDRLLLCGDAAHTMSPIGGQGMNTGFADAWMLAKVLQDPAPARLTAYTRERQRAFRTAARRVALGMHLGTRTGTAASRLRAHLLRTALHHPGFSNTLARTFAMRNLPHPLQS